MQRAHATLIFCLVLACSVAAPTSRAVAEAFSAPLLFGRDLIHHKQAVPDDPLAGLPTDDGRGGEKGHASSKAMCSTSASPTNDRDIGDLRATLAFVKHGPSAWICPARPAQNNVRLRIGIDGTGKISRAEPVDGDNAIAMALAKRLPGKMVGARAEGATVGTVVVTFATRRP
jgi:hypothetical protein